MTAPHDSLDLDMMGRCIELARGCTASPDLPISSVVARGSMILAEATNAVSATRDVSRHAEIIALSLAQQKRDGLDLAGCTLYSLVEPCAMCAFAIRESRIARVVYAINSPMLGGHSKWSILDDGDLGSSLSGFFGHAPEIRSGVRAREAEDAFEAWNPIVWSVMKRRRLFAVGEPHAHPPKVSRTLGDCLRRPTEALGWLRHATRVRR
jgi:tRNA(adenine34) deaminase